MSELVSHHPTCLGCGTDNPASLGLRIFSEDHRVSTTMCLDERHTGAPGFVHGGAVATAFDDLLGTLPLLEKRPAVTAKLEIDYRRPMFLGVAYAMEAWLDRVEGRKLHLAGHAHDEAGELVAEAYALFVEVDVAHFRRGSDGSLPW